MLVLSVHLMEPPFSSMPFLTFKASSYRLCNQQVVDDIAEMQSWAHSHEIVSIHDFFSSMGNEQHRLVKKRVSQFTAWFKENMKHFRDFNF